MFELTLYADFVCPFSYVAEQAILPELAASHDLRLTWRPYQLHPDAPAEGTALPRSDAGRIWGSARRLAERFDLDVSRKAPQKTPNTLPALAASEAAREQGLLDDFRTAAYHAYFVKGRDLGDVQVLSRLVPGLDLSSLDRHLKTVQETRQAALSAGVNAVPAFQVGQTVLHGILELDEYAPLFAT